MRFWNVINGIPIRVFMDINGFVYSKEICTCISEILSLWMIIKLLKLRIKNKKISYRNFSIKETTKAYEHFQIEEEKKLLHQLPFLGKSHNSIWIAGISGRKTFEKEIKILCTGIALCNIRLKVIIPSEPLSFLNVMLSSETGMYDNQKMQRPSYNNSSQCSSLSFCLVLKNVCDPRSFLLTNSVRFIDFFGHKIMNF